MTLILTLVTPSAILQVSDRKVTRGGRSFDDASNKNLIFIAKDAFVTFGFSGRAYVDGAPTDHWIAEQLVDARLPLEFGMLHSSGPDVQLQDIGRVIRRITYGLTSAYAKMGGCKDQLSLVCAGIQHKNRRIRPVIWLISNSLGTPGLFAAWRTHRHRFLPRKQEDGEWRSPTLMIVAPKGHLTPEEEKDLGANLNVANLDSCESAFLTAVRRVASRSPLVGADCMSILLKNNKAETVRIRYLADIAHRYKIQTQDCELSVPATFAPWLVHPGLIQQPSSIVGGGTGVFCGISVNIDAPPVQPGPLRYGIFHQKRPPDPYAPRRGERPFPPMAPTPPFDISA